MVNLKNMHVKNKLIFSFGAIVLLSVLTVVILISSMASISTSVNKLYEGPYQNIDDIWTVRRNLIDIQRAINRLMAEDNDNMAQRYSTFKSTVDTDVNQMKASMANLETQLLNGDDRTRLANMQASITEGEAVRANLMELLENGDFEDAYDLNYDTYLPIVNGINDMALELFQAVSEDADEFVAHSNRNSLFSIAIGIVMTVAGIIIAVVISVVITRMIVNPVKQITAAAEEMYKGDMKASRIITYESRDELGILADSMRGTMINLDHYVAEIKESLVQIAKGDLTQSSDEITDFLGDFSSIKESLVYILKRFNTTLSDIRTSSDKVDSGSTEIAGASQSLSEGTTEEANALQELSATIETVSEMAEDSAQKTQEAYEKVKKSTEEAESGSQQMKQLTEEMKRITAISKEIENIITAIEDIASQTNLLSLNASIEAARAGEAGKGFAVVADQIGKLASDSAASAVNTRELIIKTLEEIEKGNHITLKTSESFDQVIQDMREFASAAKSTNENAKRQAVSLQEVHEGIEQISAVVQNTASASEETSAISGQLSEEADRLDKLVRRFKLFKNGDSLGFHD